MFKTLVLCSCLLLFAQSAQASDHLLYFEGQEIFGYSSALEKTVAYSINPQSEMQKPSLGFDYLQRLSGETGDVAVFALQARLAVTQVEQGQGYRTEPRALSMDQDGYTLEPQVYNAYLKVKTPWAYAWVGHNRPAFGLASYLDSHGQLLETVGMRFGFYDRDWGVGGYKDFSWGDISASVTTGSGMPLYQSLPGTPFESHYMTAARVSYGVLARDNFDAGFSLGYGRTLSTVGYTLMDIEPHPMKLAGADLTIFQDNLEHRFDLYTGEWLGKDLFALFYRFGVNLDQEGRFKIEAQPMYWKLAGVENQRMALCFTVLATSNLTVRTEYAYDRFLNDNRFLLQLYYYSPL